MKEHEFKLILDSDPDDEEADTLYGIFNDGTISTVAGFRRFISTANPRR